MIVEDPEAEAGQGYAVPIKDRDAADQPRERALAHGCSSLSTPDLWALVLRTGLPGKPVTELCRDLMRLNGQSLHTLERRSHKELRGIKGIGTTKAIQIEAVMELIRRYNLEEPASNPQIKSSADIYSIMGPKIGNLPHEEMWVLMLNRSNRVVKLQRLTSGGTSNTVFDVKLMLKSALLENAEAIVLCHNHPSGNLNPSAADDSITRLCKQACSTMQISMLDHLIITAKGFFSYADHSRL